MNTNHDIFLIDGTAYIFRAFHSLPALYTKNGFPTGAILGFTKMLVKFLNQATPGVVIVIFDTGKPTFRHKLFPEYKAHRPETPPELKQQIEPIINLVKAFNLPALSVEGYEADDVIGTLAVKLQEKAHSITIVSGDKDFMQLCSPKVKLWDNFREKLTGVEEVEKRLEIKAHQVVDYFALCGDKSDNIPGVKGIGAVNAAKLLKNFGSLEEIYKHIDQVNKKNIKQHLQTNQKNAFLSRQLFTIKTDLPDHHLPQLEEILVAQESPLNRINRKAVRELLSQFDMTSLMTDLVPQQILSNENYQTVKTWPEFEQLLSRLEQSEEIALDLETTGLDPMSVEIVGISLCTEPGISYYIPLAHNYIDVEQQLPKQKVLSALTPLLQNEKKRYIGQNIKYDYIILHRHGIELPAIYCDTLLAAYLLDPGGRNLNLDMLAERYLHHKTITFNSLVKEMGLKKNTPGVFVRVPIPKATLYSCEDSDVTFRLFQILTKKIAENGFNSLFHELEVPLIKVLADMEMNGIKVNSAHLHQLSESLREDLNQLEVIIHQKAGESFNLNSPKQLSHILFEKLNYPATKKTKTGYSTNQEVLEQLARTYELPSLILQYRSLNKLLSTYIDVLPRLVNPATGRIHTSFNQAATATGRLSSSDPNLQNIPVRTTEGKSIRAAFIPREGCRLLSADYSQIELRVLAHLSKDEHFIQAFKQGEDIHLRTAMEILSKKADKITDADRRIAKNINFGVVYGISSFRLANQLNITRKAAKEHIDNFFLRYPGIKSFMDQSIEKAKKDGKVSTILNRHRLIPEINSSNGNIAAGASRMAFNTIIQGSAADIIKIAMLRVFRALKRTNLKTALLLQVHDELLLEVPEEEIGQVTTLVKEEMEGAFELESILKVDISIGDDWSQAH